MKITVMAPGLIYALTAAIPHASTDDQKPDRNVVGLRVIDGRLYVSATDGYTFGIGHLATVGKSEPTFEAVVSLDDAKQLLQIVKMAQAQVGRLVETEINLTVESNGRGLVVLSQWKNHTLRLIQNESKATVLAWRHLVPETFPLDHEISAVRGYNPRYLARFTKAMTDKLDTMITYQATGHKPSFVVIGNCFFGLIMPVKTDLSAMLAKLPAMLGGGGPNTEEEEINEKVKAVLAPSVTPTKLDGEEEKPDLAGKKPATVRPFADSPKLPPLVAPKRAPAKKAAAKKAGPEKAA